MITNTPKISLMPVIATSLLAFFIALFISPVVVSVEISFNAIMYVIACYLSLLTGIFFYTVLPKKNSVTTRLHSDLRAKKIFYITAGIATIIVLVSFFNVFMVKKLSLHNNFLQNRAQNLTVKHSFSQMILNVSYPICFLPFFIHAHIKSALKRPNIWGAISLAFFFIPSMFALLLGSRSTMLVSVSMLVLAFLILNDQKITLHTLFSRILAPLAIMTVIAGIVLFARLDAMNLSYLTSMQKSGYAYTLKATPIIHAIIYAHPDSFIAKVLFIIVNLFQYYLHGMFEFFYLYMNFNGVHTHGQDMFAVIFKFLGVFHLFHYKASYVYTQLPRVGVYTTFFGPLFVDFGWHGITAMFIFGLLIAMVVNHYHQNSLSYLPLLTYLLVVVWFMPMFNLVSGAQGIYIITIFSLYAFLTRRRGINKCQEQ